MLLHASFGLLPILLFLLVLQFLDSYKLVRLAPLLRALAAGALAAGLCYLINSALLPRLPFDFAAYSIAVAPWVEELMKFLYLAVLLKSGRIAFMVDGAILGFAIGAGFGVIENIYYLQALPDAGVLTWIVRGFGTGIMHGGVVAVAAITARMFAERGECVRLWHLLPGWVLAVALHAGFNALGGAPILATVIVLGLMPAITILSFSASEAMLRRWLDLGFATDTELLRSITSGTLADTPIGRHVRSIRSSFPPEVVADMLCYIRLVTELSVRAKGLLLLKELGMPAPQDPAVQDKFTELRYLQRSIGRSGILTLSTILRHSPRDLWQLTFLEQQG